MINSENTIVSGFIKINNNNNNNISILEYYEYGKHILYSDTPKIIFLDENIYNILKPEDFNNKNTYIHKLCKEDIYLYNYIKYININDNIITDNPDKDTLDYLMLMCYKTELMRKAVEINYFNTTNFIWVDFGIKKIIKCSNLDFINKLNNIRYNIKDNDKIRIGNILSYQDYINYNFYRKICWFFPGGIFSGNQKVIIKFANLVKDKCIYLMSVYKLLTWEVNVWYMIYLDNKNLFSLYKCNHNDTIIDNY